MKWTLQLLGCYGRDEWATVDNLQDESLKETCARWLKETHRLTKGIVRVKHDSGDAGAPDTMEDIEIGGVQDYPGYVKADIRRVATNLRMDSLAVARSGEVKDGRGVQFNGVSGTLAVNLSVFTKALNEERRGRRGFVGGLLPSQCLGYLTGLEDSLPGDMSLKHRVKVRDVETSAIIEFKVDEIVTAEPYSGSWGGTLVRLKDGRKFGVPIQPAAFMDGLSAATKESTRMERDVELRFLEDGYTVESSPQ